MSTRRSMKGFNEFLAAQKDRQDVVGLVARERERKRPAILRMFLGGPDRETLARGAARAMFEYDAQFKK